jgi:hypothetical protein
MFYLSTPLFVTSDLSKYSNRISLQFTSHYKLHIPIIDSGEEILRLCYQNGKCSISACYHASDKTFP